VSGVQQMTIACDDCGCMYERGDRRVAAVRTKAHADGWCTTTDVKHGRRGMVNTVTDLCPACARLVVE
jgi:hypothetical protein